MDQHKSNSRHSISPFLSFFRIICVGENTGSHFGTVLYGTPLFKCDRTERAMNDGTYVGLSVQT